MVFSMSPRAVIAREAKQPGAFLKLFNGIKFGSKESLRICWVELTNDAVSDTTEDASSNTAG